MKSVLTSLIVVALGLVGCTSVESKSSVAGVYSTYRYPSYEPMWMELRPDGRFLLKSGFDAPVDIGGGKLGHTKEEAGRWKFESAHRIIAITEESQGSRIYFVTIIADSPRGAGVFVSSRRED